MTGNDCFATVIGLLPRLKDGVNHVFADSRPKIWKLCDITPVLLTKFKTPEGCLAAALRALKSAGNWWGDQWSPYVGPTEDDLLYCSTLTDAQIAANVVATSFEITALVLSPKDF